MNKGTELFEKHGWSVLYRRNDVSVLSPQGKMYKVCDKYFGGDGYDEELQQAFNNAKEKGLIAQI